MSKCRILTGNIFPERPASAVSNFRIFCRGMILIAVNRSFCTASIGNKYKIIFCQRDFLYLAMHLAFNGSGCLLLSLHLKTDIGHFRSKLKLHTCPFQIFLHRKNERFILIIPSKFQCRKIRQSTDMVNKSLEIPLHLQGTVPVFKCKHRTPVEPEIRTKYFVIKDILNRLIIEIFVFHKEQFHDLHAALLTQTEFAIGMGILSTVHCCTTQRIVRIMFVQPIIFIQHRCIRYFQRRNTSEQVPQTFKMILHLAAATHDIAPGRVVNTVTCTSRNVHGL